MRHPLQFGRSYSTEMLRNKAQLSAERVGDSGRSVAARHDTPGLGNIPLKATRTS